MMNDAKEKYSVLTIKELRAELKTRNAKLSGRKHELVDRLEAYDRNSNFGRLDIIEPEFAMTTPLIDIYKDINSGTVFPHITTNNISIYLSTAFKEMSEGPKQLYDEKFLRFARLAIDSNLFYVKTQCCAEMKKNVVYNIDVSFSSDGVIQQCQCECASGMGPFAHCKHVCTILYGLHMFPIKKQIITAETCTQQLQTFNQTPKYKGSPVKVGDLKLKRGSIKGNVRFDPRHQDDVGKIEYDDHFRNSILNFRKFVRMPISDIIPPANLYAVANDHDYLPLHPEDHFLLVNRLKCISVPEQAEIEFLTRGQRTNQQWHTERNKRINSSKFGRICKLTDRTDVSKLAKSLMEQSLLRSDPIIHGQKYEQVAVNKYIKLSGNNVSDCGTFVSTTHPYLASSPDGIVNDKKLIEVKCPFTARNMEITPLTVPYLELVNNELSLKQSDNYYYQVQGQLECSKRQECDFIVFTFEDFKIINIKKNEHFISEMLTKLEAFFNTTFQLEFLRKNFYKNYDALQPQKHVVLDYDLTRD